MDEFALIDQIVDALGAASLAEGVSVGPGDDAAVIRSTPGLSQVASIDTLLADVHFPQAAPAQLIGYRTMMVALSDLAAMAASPRYALVSLTLDQPDPAWVRALAQGMAEAALSTNTGICGGNLSRGPMSITVSVHGEAESSAIPLRAGARPGDGVYVSGPLGAAAGCVRRRDYEVGAQLTPAQQAYFKPQARFDCQAQLAHASAAIDISDGLVADLHHIANASSVGLQIATAQIPLGAEAALDDALYGGDDYQLAATSEAPLEGFHRIGQVVQQTGVYLDGEPAEIKGKQ